MKVNNIMRIIILTAVIVIILFCVLAYWLAGYIMTGKRQTLEEAAQWQSEHYDISYFNELEKTDYTVTGSDGYTLHAEFLKNSTDTGRYIILSHGYTDNRMGALKYVKMYLDLGFSCIIYDLRGHGLNASDFTTYGQRESADLDLLIKDTRSRYKDISVLGLHGESLGAATTVTVMKYRPDVDFAVADCGFSDIGNVLIGSFAERHLPAFFLDIADIGSRFRFGYSLKKMNPIDSLDDNTVPILFIHGASDDFILPKNSEDMAARTKGVSELHFIDGAGHAESILTDPVLYKKYVSGFLEKNVF